MRRTPLILATVIAVSAVVALPPPAQAQVPPAVSPDTTLPGDATISTVAPQTTVPTTAPTGTVTPVSPSTTLRPTTTIPTDQAAPAARAGAATAPKLRGVGDSVFLSAKDETLTALSPEYRPAFKAVLAASIAEMTPAARDFVTRNPAIMVLGLGNPDVADMDDDYFAPFDAARVLLRATRNVPCVVWVNIKQQGVNGFYNQAWQAHATVLNNWLVDATRGVGLAYDNLHILDWNSATESQPGWFDIDGLHLLQAGQTAYANKIDRFVNRVCPPT